ncbi:phosphatase PAP2 family protein [Streptomyces triticagri]|uniref:Phosphatase PAP2 family protein n=1 Tax=Streptomyces triticagri TaxID=2293568 RepID=A0A372LZS5_9ACTN|nr:phosphatase PAP2 family protein [Streptomyces triticagri]
MDPNTPIDTSGLYRDITDFAADTPEWTQHVAELWTEGGLLLFGVLFIVAWWRTRHSESRALAVAVLAPLATALAYVGSELFKSLVDEERPCRAVSGAATSLVTCPPVGDWSFPSNHSTIAGAAAVALALAWRGIGWLTLPMAVLMAFSRVFVGVHYPHDVAVGLLLGALVAFLVLRLGERPAGRVVESMRGSSTGVVRWFAGPGRAVPGGHGVPSAADHGYAGQGYGSQPGQAGHEPVGHGGYGGYGGYDPAGHGERPDTRGSADTGYTGYPGYAEQPGHSGRPHQPHQSDYSGYGGYSSHPGRPDESGHPDDRPAGPAS